MTAFISVKLGNTGADLERVRVCGVQLNYASTQNVIFYGKFWINLIPYLPQIIKQLALYLGKVSRR